MTNERETSYDDGDQEVRELLQAAGPRAEIPVADLAAVKDAARVAWGDLVDEEPTEGSQPDPRRVFAIAASLLLALVIGWWIVQQTRDGQPPVPAETVATVVRITGAVWLDGRQVAFGDEILAGSELTVGTDANPAALQLTGGQSLRLDTGSRVTLDSPNHVGLLAGAIYVDSNMPQSTLEVLTPFGAVREIGTQYEIRLDEETNTLRVRVREGLVSIQDDTIDLEAEEGDELLIAADGSASRSTIAPDDAEWLWVLEAAPAIDTEGHSLADLLTWVGRETGWEIRYEDEALSTLR